MFSSCLCQVHIICDAEVMSCTSSKQPWVSLGLGALSWSVFHRTRFPPAGFLQLEHRVLYRAWFSHIEIMAIGLGP